MICLEESGNDERTLYVEIFVAVNEHFFHTASTKRVIPNAVLGVFRIHLLSEFFSHFLKIFFREKAFEHTVLNRNTEV